MSKIKEINKQLAILKNPEKAKLSTRFFKTAKGEYGYGDQFLGISVPELRKISKNYRYLELESVIELLQSKWHEARLLALFIMVLQYKSGNKEQQNIIFNTYISNYKYINNWDLVDSSAYQIVGAHLHDKNKDLIRQWVKSQDLWQRRIAIVSTFYSIKQNNFSETIRLSELLLNDKEDLMHKATGWMLREVGKKDASILEDFLNKHYKKMPRTMLRYSIEKFSEQKRRAYLTGLV